MRNLALRKRTLSGALQTAGLTVLLVGLTLLAAWRIMGPWSIAAAVVLAFLAVRLVGRSTLPRRLANARLLHPTVAPGLHQMIAWLSNRAGLERAPRLYLSASPAPNAAAMGRREEAAILVTPSLLQGLSERELAGVLAHEVTHIRNNDLGLFRFTEVLRWLAVLSSQVGWFLLVLSLPMALLGRGAPLATILLLVAAPLGAQLLQLAIMRSRELAADVGAVELTGDAVGLASALRRIEMANRSVLRVLLPFPVAEETSMMRTHPHTVERVRRLLELQYALG